MAPENGIIQCSAIELYYLGTLLEGNSIVGIADPFPGWLTEEIADALIEAHSALVRRGYLSVQDSGEVLIEQRVAAMVDALVYPVASFLVTVTAASGQTDQHVFHVKDPLPLAVEVSTAEPSIYRLVALGGARSVLQRIVVLWELEHQLPAVADPGSLPDDVLLEARNAAAQRGAAAAETILLAGGLGAATAGALAQSLAGAVRNGALITLRSGELEWQTSGLGMLDSPHGLWCLTTHQKDDEPQVHVVPASADQLIADLRGLMANVVEFALVLAPEA